MNLDELLELRTKVIEKRNELIKLNNEYNKLLTAKHLGNENALEKDMKIIRESLAYKIMYIIRLIIPLCVGMLIVFNAIGPLFLMTYFILMPVLGTIFETSILPKIVFGKGYKPPKPEERKKTDKKEMDELYERVCEARFTYHSLRHEFEDKVIEAGLSDSDEYQEYLKLIDNVIEESETVDTASKSNNKDEKKLNLK